MTVNKEQLKIRKRNENYLFEYLSNQREIEVLKEKIDLIESKQTNISAKLTDMPTAKGTGKNFTDYSDEKGNFEKDIKKLQERCEKIRLDVEALSIAREREVLRYYYFMDIGVFEIAERMSLSIGLIYKLKRSGCENLKRIEI